MTMTQHVVPTVVQQPDLPPTVLSLSTLPTVDYADMFTVTTDGEDDATAEQWARVALEGASPKARFLIWQVACGLRLEPSPSPTNVAGWVIDGRGDGWIRLAAASWFMTTQAVVTTTDDTLSVALLVHYHRPVGALLWPPLSVGHRRAMPQLLRHAVRRMNRKRSGHLREGRRGSHPGTVRR